MNKLFTIKKGLFFVTLLVFFNISLALAKPVFTFTPEYPFPSEMHNGNVESAEYIVTNNFATDLNNIRFSSSSSNVTVEEADTSSCTQGMTLAKGASCNLKLNITAPTVGEKIAGSIKATSCCIFGSLLPFSIGLTENQVWQRIGPYHDDLKNAADVSVVTGVGSTVYVGTYGSGVYRSKDDGLTWKPINEGLSDSYIHNVVYTMAIDPSDPKVVYVGLNQKGVYKSFDGGDHWVAKNVALPANRDVLALAIDPNNTQTVYMATFFGMYNSIDGGGHWMPMITSFPFNYVYSLAVNPNGSQVLYAGTLFSGVYKSADRGVSWSPVLSAATLNWSKVTAITIDSVNSDIVYVCSSTGVYKSLDEGLTWSKLHGGLPTDLNVQTLVIDPMQHNTLYLCALSGGVYKSEDAGDSWVAISNGMSSPNSSVRSLYIKDGQSSVLYAGATVTSGGVYKTTDAGSIWEDSGLRVPAPRPIRSLALAADPFNTNSIFAGLYGLGLYHSKNAGGDWVKLDAGFTNNQVSSVVMDPNNKNTLYSTVDGDGLYKSTDDGVIWTLFNANIPGPYDMSFLGIDPSDSDRLYLVNQNLLYKTIDAGQTWTKVSFFESIHAGSYYVVVDPSDSQIIYVATSKGLYKTRDNGLAWTRVNYDWFLVLSIDYSNPQIIYAGANNKLEKSINGGETWKPITSGLPSGYIDIRAPVIVNPTNSQILYVALYGHGVYRSENGGASWAPYNDGLDDSTVQSLIYAPSATPKLYTGATYQSVFSRIAN